MIKVTISVGRPRKKHTYNAAKNFLQRLHSLGTIETELFRLCDYKLQTCRGCRLCPGRGEELCPLNGDKDQLIEKISGRIIDRMARRKSIHHFQYCEPISTIMRYY